MWLVWFPVGKSREVETFVTKPLISPGAGQAHLEYSYGKTVRWELSSRSLSEDLVPARQTPNVGNHLSICELRFGIDFGILFCRRVTLLNLWPRGVLFCAREYDAMHEFGVCGKQGTHASTPGPARRDFKPGGKMSTAGLSNLVVKEAHAREFVRTAIMS